MQGILGSLTIFFEDPFWIGLFERNDDQGFAAARVVFGAQPSDPELVDFLLHRWQEISFSKPVADPVGAIHPVDFKRRQREARRIVSTPKRSTKAQEALKREYEEIKLVRKDEFRENQDVEEERKFHMRQEKRKEKHNGH